MWLNFELRVPDGLHRMRTLYERRERLALLVHGRPVLSVEIKFAYDR
jgi:hypothetical protein